MNPELARSLYQVLRGSLENEFKTTRRVIAAIPETNKRWRPDEKAKSAAELAHHIADADVWFLDCIAGGAFVDPHPHPAPQDATVTELLAWYDQHLARGLAAVDGLTDAQLAQSISFYGMFDYPAVTYLSFLSHHMAHHRGQLSVYLRPMGSKCPSIYGGSADEPMGVAATS